MTDTPAAKPAKTYRHRNTKHRSTVKDRIHTFWVGQRVVRSWERGNFIDQIGEEGVVVALPDMDSPFRELTVKTSKKDDAKWGTTGDAIPYVEWAKRNAQRLRRVSDDYYAHARGLDVNGFPLTEEDKS